MESYKKIVEEIINEGEWKDNRTGIRAYTVAGIMFKHDMQNGFSLLTGKKMPFKTIATELEFFIKGLTDKQWLRDRRCYIWDEWATPLKAPYGHSDADKQRMLDEIDLGPIYGYQWRHYNAPYQGQLVDYSNQGIDQLKNLVDKLHNDPSDRRMIVTAWNPEQIADMALPPCHYGFQVTVLNGYLNLLWNQRSVDTMLGLPFNIASYALLLHLLAKEANLKEGKLIGFLSDVHIYENHLGGALAYLKNCQSLFTLPQVVTDNFTDIFNWQATDSHLLNYRSHDKIDFPIAV